MESDATRDVHGESHNTRNVVGIGLAAKGAKPLVF